ncbi:hypothetical protein [Candidatus Phytoplasma melaleucae]|uniref:Uncharacterized protein n=1 Tax=Candidatus Phytoplasma melaleucae TaxID=2982630 RepID=A0ABT9DDM7_9MOLU|nr:hypothetical protein ['Melaleuca sp.' phytoplasma]MDO8168147.1 hypothetical protein ['Melaleuca sp.' phytoplasma]
MMNKLEFIWKKFCCHNFWHSKFFAFIICIINIFFIFFIISCKINRDIYKNNKVHFSNVFNNKEIIELQTNDITESEETVIGLKSMYIGIIICITFLGLKKGVFGITLGTFIGACLGIWLAILFPSIIYFMELIWRNTFNT